MLTTKTVIVGLSCAVLFASTQLVRAQSVDTGIVQKGQNPYAEEPGYSPYSQAHLKIDVLESQLQTLRKKVQLQAGQKAHESEEWNRHYETVKKHIEAWDKFQDEYNIE